MQKSIASFLCAGLLALSVPASAFAENEVNIVIDQTPIVIPADDQPAIVLNSRTFVPLRVISENLGTTVQWLPATKQVVIITPKVTSTVIPDPSMMDQGVIEIVVDGKVLKVSPEEGLPFITDKNRTMVPFRVISEALGCGVQWKQESRTVEIKRPVVTPTPPTEKPEVVKPEPSLADIEVLKELAGYKTNLRLLDRTVINSSDLLNMDAANFSAEQLKQFRTYRDQLKKYGATLELPDGTVVNTAELSIFGPSIATADQLRAWIAAETPRMQAKMAQLNREFVPIPDLAELYIKIGEEYGIRGDLAFCQAAKETHYWQFTGDVQPWQNNYCGLWATGSPLTGQESYNGADSEFVRFEEGVHGAIFASPEAGVEAHIQHLYAYATKRPLPDGKVLVDPRFNLVAKGSAATWQGLNARWAVPGTTYGQSIIHDYWQQALSK
ncbi:stalk domain-containing protein [Desulforamulus reducens]|uniref:stalk domain-containing protein n=1 Tax=Desulforamulus reducens TaxID=59610 RepID=UPI0018DB3A9D|nr:stalk domain-containing protein [Desulforamulus reducens]